MTRLGFEPGLGQEPKAGLAPCEINTDVKQSIGTSARARKLQDSSDGIGLAGDERHRLSGDVVWGGIHAENQIAGTDGVAHDFHPLRRRAK